MANRVTVAFLSFIAVAFVADLAGWGHSYRGLGLSLVYFLALAVCLGLISQRVVIAGLLLFSVGIAALACVQQFYMERPRGIYASANFLGACAVLYLCLAPYLRVSAGQLKWLCDTAVVANLISLALSQSRGALIAGTVAVAIMGWRDRRFFVVAIIICALFTIACLSFFRLGRNVGFDDPRLGIWLLGAQIGLGRPFLGWGQGGVVVSGLGVFYNVALEWFINAGIVGLAAGAWLYTEALRSTRLIGNQRERTALTAFLAAWAVQGMFLFSTTATIIPLLTVIGIIASVTRAPVKKVWTWPSPEEDLRQFGYREIMPPLPDACPGFGPSRDALFTTARSRR